MPFDKALMSYLLSQTSRGLEAKSCTETMEMSLIHAGLAAGAALAALPVILHLFMRQTPKHIIFPALRLIRERQKQSKKTAAGQELALAPGADGAPGPDGAGAGAAAAVFGDLAGRRGGARRRWAWSSTPACRWNTRTRTRRGSTRRRSGPRRSSTRCPIRAWSSSSIRPSRACRSGLSPAAARKRIDGLAHPRRQSAAQRRDGAGVRGGRRLRPAPPRGLCLDRPGPLGLGPGRPRRGSTMLPRSSRAWSPTCSG